MKYTICAIILTLFLSLNAISQDQTNEKKYRYDLVPNLELTGGYLFGDIDAYKANISANNIIANGVGIYTSFEFAADKEEDYFSNIIGLTGTVLPWMYVFGGFDFFTKRGIFANDPTNPIKSRKEIGIGVIPVKWFVIRAGYSTSVEWTLSAGVQIPLK